MSVRFVVGGSLDASRLRESRVDFEQLAHAGQDVTIDMSDVDFIDPSGVGALVFVLKRVKAAGRNFALVNTKGQPQQLLSEIGLVS